MAESKDWRNKLEPHLRNVKVITSDLDQTKMAAAVEAAQLAMYEQPHRQFEQAKAIKDHFDKAYGPAWHVIVGENYASFVTHEFGTMVYFSVGSTNILVFKHL
jgi:dynein light chain LC8-type